MRRSRRVAVLLAAPWSIVAVLLAAPWSIVASQAARVTSPAERQLITQLVAIEDARDTVVMGNDVRGTGLASGNPFVRAFAVRGLGRLERASLLDIISPSLQDPSAEVRAAAADAIAQSVAHGGEDAARSRLEARLASEGAPAVRSMLYESIGRLRQGSVDRLRTTSLTLVPGLLEGAPVRHGAIRGLFFLSRKSEARTPGALSTEATDRAFSLLTAGDQMLSSEDRVNLAGLLVNAGALDGRITALATHADPYVRDRGIAALLRSRDTALVQRIIIFSAMRDSSAIVRYRAISVYVRYRNVAGCGPLADMTSDRDETVALAAIDALSVCRGDPLAIGISGQLVGAGRSWQERAHALVAFASLDPARARPLFFEFETPGNFFNRMYLASAARLAADTAVLYRLAGDSQQNVRSVAIDGLSSLVGHGADSVYRAALTSDDNQLLMRATAALKGATADNDATLTALYTAWKRIHDANPGRETSKDGLKALADRIVERGGMLRDTSPMTIPKLSTPTFDDLAAMEKLTATIEMADGSVIDFKLHPFEAPTNAARFVRLARAGTFDGLTFHRIAPFFVVQGPSPNANEYSAPDGPFTRDELSHSNLRGTIGLSTRGRDTGDGQFYVNLVDNVYLDHDYTVMGTVVRGLDAFDRMQEGAMIKRIFVR